MRSQGMRPIQIWVPDVNATSFASEAHRQSVALANSADDEAVMDFIEDAGDGVWAEE